MEPVQPLGPVAPGRCWLPMSPTVLVFCTWSSADVSTRFSHIYRVHRVGLGFWNGWRIISVTSGSYPWYFFLQHPAAGLHILICQLRNNRDLFQFQTSTPGDRAFGERFFKSAPWRLCGVPPWISGSTSSLFSTCLGSIGSVCSKANSNPTSPNFGRPLVVHFHLGY